MERELTERAYLGVGYIHRFVNDKTGEILFVPCTEQEYFALTEVDGHAHNPKLKGYTWVCSEGGTVKVDTPDTVLGKDEYCIVDGKAFVRFDGVEDLSEQFKILKSEDIVDSKIDESFVLKK